MTVAAPARTAEVQSQNDEYWQAKRASHPANGLLRPTMNWASALPNDAQPSALLDKRGNRQGFPLDVLRELFALRAHYDQVHPETSRPWEVMNNGQ